MPGPRRAILSVSDKRGILEFSRGLVRLGCSLLASDGTAKTLRAEGVPVRTITEYTGQPEILGGRVKTLHPKVFGAILATPGSEAELARFGVEPVDLVVVNLYPFEETIAAPGASHADAVENIDVGGVSLIRAAAKNADRVTVVVRPERYPEVLQALRSGGVPPALRAELTAEAFALTSGYDTAIYNYLARRASGAGFPPALRLALPKASDLRYGENPYQKATLYVEPTSTASVAAAERLNGKDLSYNNLVDFDAALKLALEFDRPAAVVVKHTNPCGAAVADRLVDAYAAAHASDPVSAYGGIIGLNRAADLATAEAMRKHALDGVIAPAYEEDALEILRGKKKGAFLVLRAAGEFRRGSDAELLRILGGVLVQTTDFPEVRPESWRVVTTRAPSAEALRDMAFGVRVSRYVKSNSIVLASAERTVGVGAGQMSRVDACAIAVRKAGPRGRGSVAVSDAYFPFRDGLDELGRGGVAAVAQPGGSIRDPEVIAAAEEHGVAMVFTGTRLFKH